MCLRVAREQRGLTQAKLSALSGIGRSQISKYEAGKEHMKLETLERLLEPLSMLADEF